MWELLGIPIGLWLAHLNQGRKDANGARDLDEIADMADDAESREFADFIAKNAAPGIKARSRYCRERGVK